MISKVDSLLERDGLAASIALVVSSTLATMLAAGQIPAEWVGFASGVLAVIAAFVPASARRASNTRRRAMEAPQNEPGTE